MELIKFALMIFYVGAQLRKVETAQGNGTIAAHLFALNALHYTCKYVRHKQSILAGDICGIKKNLPGKFKMIHIRFLMFTFLACSKTESSAIMNTYLYINC